MLRELTKEEINLVAGGTDDDEIVVIGPRNYWVTSISGDEFRNMMLSSYNFMSYSDYQLMPASNVFDAVRDWLNENLDWLAEQFGYDLINAEDQSRLNAEMNTKQVAQVGTYHFQDGTKWNFVDTTDGVRYYDRNNDGQADLAVRNSEFGVQTNTGDGSGWSMPTGA
jgi:hypothetical protein